MYDVQYEMENGQESYIRGVVSVTETQKEFLIAVRFAVILLPLTVILTALMAKFSVVMIFFKLES